MPCRKVTIAMRPVHCLVVGLALGAPLRGQDAAESPEIAPAVDIDEEAVSQWITGVVRNLLPTEYENTRDWGKTKRVLDGWKIHRDGLQIKTKRRWKEANHGTWKMYRVQPLAPEEQFQIRVQNIQRQANGSVAFDFVADARLAMMGRLAEWAWDVQLYSFSAEGTARLYLTARCELAMRLDPSRVPPDLLLRPKVIAADLRVYEFRVDRISKLDGSLAEEIGRGMRRALEEKLEEDRPELAEKLNRQIGKNQEKLRLSLRDALASKWGPWINPAALDTAPAPSE